MQPCVPPSVAKAAKVQRTLAEVWKGAATSDVLARSRGDDLCRYQEERRCACASRKGSREGCSFAVDQLVPCLRWMHHTTNVLLFCDGEIHFL